MSEEARYQERRHGAGGVEGSRKSTSYLYKSRGVTVGKKRVEEKRGNKEIEETWSWRRGANQN